MSRMFWQRCARCGRLNLASLGMTAACECGGASAGPPRLGAPAQPPSLPAGSGPSATPAAPASRRLTMLTPEQDAATRALLVSALGEEWTF